MENIDLFNTRLYRFELYKPFIDALRLILTKVIFIEIVANRQKLYVKQFRCPRNFSEGIVLLGEFVFSGNLSRQYRDIIEIKYR